MAALEYFASDAVVTWLELWAGEMSIIVLVLSSFVSLAFRSPFTLQYARETAPKEYWDQPLFLRTHDVITWVRALACLIGAIAFTGVLPRVQVHKAMLKAGLETDPHSRSPGCSTGLPIVVLITGLVTESVGTTVGGRPERRAGPAGAVPSG